MRIEQDRLSQIKNYIYIGVSALLFLVWVLSLAAMTQKGGVDGRLAWVFGLVCAYPYMRLARGGQSMLLGSSRATSWQRWMSGCFLTIPMIIYQSLTPIWSRTARFSKPHAHCAVDALLCVLWLSAWASLASYVLSGKGKGDIKNAAGVLQTGCANFLHGSASKCTISEVDIVFSVLLMLCFVATGFLSFKVLMEYKRTGIAPNAAYSQSGGKVNKTDISYPQNGQDKEDDEAFDSRMNLGVDHRRDSAYSFEVQRVQGGAPTGGYGGLGTPAPYVGGGGYASVPNPGEGGYDMHERPTSFGGPLNRI